MSRPCYQKNGFVIVENRNKKKNYYTVINTNLREKPHSHLYTFQQAKLVIHWCVKERIPNKYTYHMRESIKRLRPDLDFNNMETNNNKEIRFDMDKFKTLITDI